MIENTNKTVTGKCKGSGDENFRTCTKNYTLFSLDLKKSKIEFGSTLFAPLHPMIAFVHGIANRLNDCRLSHKFRPFRNFCNMFSYVVLIGKKIIMLEIFFIEPQKILIFSADPLAS